MYLYENGLPFSYLFIGGVMKVKSTDEIKEFCAKYAEPLGIRIEEVEFKQGKNPSLTVFIDKDGGVSLDDCEKLHNAINDPIDVLDPTFGEPYTLNVSSLGADRPFKTEKDFLSHIDKMVEVRLLTAIKGKKYLEGVLKKYDGREIVIKTDEKTTLSIDLKSVQKVSDYIDFN